MIDFIVVVSGAGSVRGCLIALASINRESGALRAGTGPLEGVAGDGAWFYRPWLPRVGQEPSLVLWL